MAEGPQRGPVDGLPLDGIRRLIENLRRRLSRMSPGSPNRFPIQSKLEALERRLRDLEAGSAPSAEAPDATPDPAV